MSVRAALVAVLLLSLSCGKDDINLVRPELVPPPRELDYGAVPVLNVKEELIPLRNNGRAVLRVTSATIAESGTPFTVTGFPSEVPTSDIHSVVVTFQPPKEQDYAATLVIETNDETEPRVEVKLTGKGSTRAIMEVEPLMLDFGRVAEGTAAVKSFSIKSSGSADLILNEIAFVEGTSTGFSFVGSTRTPAVVKNKNAMGLPGALQLTVKFTATPGAPVMHQGSIRLQGTDPDKPVVSIPLTAAINRAPLAVIKPLGNGAPGMLVPLDGSMSSDPDNDLPLTYKWNLRSQPLGANTKVENDTAGVTQMSLDPKLPGEYVVELTVTDAAGAKSLMPAKATIVAAPAQKLLVEMFWNNSTTDIDVHLLRTAASKTGIAPDDCFYQNPRPDWGTAADATDNPEFLRDALTGYGPEIVGYVNPVDTTYRIVAEFAHDHAAPVKDTEVTIRIYLFGVVKAELKKVLKTKGELWNAVDVTWPSGTITPVNP